MKSIVKYAVVFAIALLPVPNVLLADETMEDPLIGMQFQVGEQRWEEVSKAEAAALKLRDGPWWVFGSHVDEGGQRRYLLLSGMTRVALDTEPVTFADPEPDFGLALVFENGVIANQCTPTGMDDPECGFTEEALKGVVDDFVARAIKGFGREAVQKSLDTATRHPWMGFFVAEGLRRAGFKVPEEIVMSERKRDTPAADK